MEFENDFGCNDNSRWFALIVSAVLAALFLTGCQSAAFHEGDYIGQGLTATADIPATPGAVVSTHQDGTVTVAPIPAAIPPGATPIRPVRPTPAAASEAPAGSPVVAVTVIPPTPGKSFSYTITPESQKGDQLGASRCWTWAGEAPGTVVEKVATQKDRRTSNPLPAVTLDDTGIHATKGGGGVVDQAGQSWFQRACTWVSDTVKGWLWWIVVIGIIVAAFFILPILVPVLAPLFASIAGAIHASFDYITSEIGKLFLWFRTFHTTPAVVPAATIVTTTIPVAPLPVTPAPLTPVTTVTTLPVVSVQPSPTPTSVVVVETGVVDPAAPNRPLAAQ